MTRPDDIPSAPIKDGTSVPGEVRELPHDVRAAVHALRYIAVHQDRVPQRLIERELTSAANVLEALATRTTQETRDEAVRQRAVEDGIREDERNRLVNIALVQLSWIDGEKERQQDRINTLRSALENLAALRKPANEKGGER